ncbi:pilus assembly FimT family protein [Salmonella enterica]|uniref:pilus assembly FimT family protein n=1 Tax=Salmonella enterica TaxID=28901 RepID=UPI003D32008F|nr:type II secretion system protein [Salmonella enterica subsp. diarizonae serovar 60:r:z]
MRKKIIESRGFSLLEVIFVLAFLGIILLTAGNYARKLIDEKTRQTAADAVVQDIYGVLQFVNAETIKTYTSNDPGDVTGRATKDVTNPLYQLPGMAVYPESEDATEAALKGLTSNPIWLAHPHSNTSLDATSADVSPYIARNYSTGITRPVSNDINMTDGGKTHYSHSLKWSQAVWGQDSVRSYFTDSGCQGGTGTGNAIYFSQQFLSCSENPALHNSEIGISRIDLVNDKGSFTRIATSDDHPAPVNRVDVYVSFRPVDENSARIEQFITPLMTAFRMQKIMPNTDNIFLVRSLSGTGNDNAWTLLNKNTGQPANKDTPVADLARYSDLPDLVGKLQKGQTYALRFTFDGKGDYLRTDGVNAATKVCWNTKDGVAGPCLTSPSPDALILKRRDNPQELANLQVGSVISKGSYTDSHGNTQPDYYTAPQIQYAAFSNTGNNVGPYYKGGTDNRQMCTADGDCSNGPTVGQITDTANGAIPVPLQTCPSAEGFTRTGTTDNHQLYPRLSAAVSSVVSGIVKDGPKGEDFSATQMVPDIFNNQSGTMTTLSGSEVTLNRLGGTVLQVRPDTASGTWRIAGMVASEDSADPLKGRSWIYFNPSWMSVMITTWCSSVEQH